MSTINHGLILGQRETDFVSGRLGASLPYEVRVPDGNWKPYLPPGEWQRNHIVDTMACVTFSALNALETQLKFFGVEKNLSDRFTAKLSGTTKEGNWLFKVADSVRKDGVLLEEEWPAPEHYTWDTYYTAPPVELLDKARKFLEEWEIGYEFVPPTKEMLLYHIKHAPLQITLPGHAILNFFNEGDIHHYFDSYEPFLKQTNAVYSALKLVLTKKSSMKFIQKLGEKELWLITPKGERLWVLDPATRDSLGISVVEAGDPYQYPYVGALGKFSPDDPHL